MMSRGKDDKNIVYGTCKSHINRSENDLYRICPSKLSKQALEDLYFALFDSNIQLKKTLNGQRDEIKVLTTKVQRLTALGNRNQACCAKSSAVINEQKELIVDLKKTNEHLSERIRLLNMRLCSAKQFLRRGTVQSTSRCSKCCLAFNTSIKNSSMSALYTKRSVGNVGIEATSCDLLDKENIPVQSTENATTQNEIKSVRDEDCQQNKCRTMMDELKEKISILEEELIKTHDQYSERLNKSVEEVTLLRNENTRARAERIVAEKHLHTQNGDLLEQLRAEEQRCGDLEAQLMIEKGKVSEMEMRLKAAELSRHVAKTLEKQYTSSIVLKPVSCLLSVNKGSPDKANDDSGYTDTSQDKSRGSGSKDSVTVQNDDRDILDQIASLQAELVSLKHSFKDHKESSEQEHSLNIDNFLQQKSNNGKSSELINGDLASNSRDIGNVNALLSVSRERDEDTNDASSKECHKQTDKCHAEDLIVSLTGNVSRIPRLKHMIRSVITELRSNEKFKNKTSDSNAIDNKETATSTNDELHENKCDENKFSKIGDNGEEVYNEVVNNRRTDLNIRNSEIKQNNDHIIKIPTISNKQLSQEPHCRKNETISQTSMIESNAANIAKDNALRDNSKDQTVNVSSTNEGDNESYVDKIKVESTKSRNDLQSDTNLISVDKTTVLNNEIKRNASHVKRRMSYVIETKPVKDKLKKVASDDHLGSRTYSLGPKKPAPLATSSPQQRTYRRGSAEVMRALSPDSTECEISSLTDLPDETDDKSPLNYLSPGEQRGSTSQYLSSDTSLSEGELFPVSKSSFDEVDLKKKIDIIGRESSMQEALRAAGAEVRRCRRMLRTHSRAAGHPHNYTPPLI